MHDEDELPVRKTRRVEPLVLDRFDVAELHEYIAELRGEIARAEAAIAAKSDHRSAAEALFRKPG